MVLVMEMIIGCMRVAKESIFTGLNNFKIRFITSVRFNEHFGFTDEEIRSIFKNHGSMIT